MDKQVLSNNDSSIASNASMEQTMQIAATLWEDTFKYLYDIDDSEILWDVEMNEGYETYIFQLQFKDTNENNANFLGFLKNFEETKCHCSYEAYEEDKIVAFQYLDDVAEFLWEFLRQNNFLPQNQEENYSLHDTPKHAGKIKRNIADCTKTELLSLQEPFYLSKTIFSPKEELSHPTAKFTYTLAQLNKSIILCGYQSQGQKTYDVNSVFHINN